MSLNLNIIGKEMDPISFRYNKDTLILYALGIGAGVGELDFVYEKNLMVFPTFAVIPFLPAFAPFALEAGLNMPAVLHGEQKIILHGPIPTSGTVLTTARCPSIYDKGDKGAIINLEINTRNEKGELLFENQAVIVDRSEGNFGGDRGPKSDVFDPPQDISPDFHVEDTTSPNQAALYRLSGDKNPLHIDPEFAQKAGFDRPILHGLCSYGFAGRALLNSLCKRDPSRLKSFAVRFVNAAFPGDTLITEGWRLKEGMYIIQTKNQDGEVILGNGLAEIA